jgi:lysophospholipase L1-like esterase
MVVIAMLTAQIAFAADTGAAGAAPATEKLFAEALKLVGPPAGEVPKELILKAGDLVVCMGDSITAGGGYLRDMDAVFAQQFPDLKIQKVVNAGISGQKAEDFIKRFDKDVVARKPAVVTINVGINDVWHRLNAPHDEKILATYKENVAKMVDLAQAAGIKVILLPPTLIQEDAEAEGQKRLTMYVDAMKAIAAEKKCGLGDLHAMFLTALKKKPADMKDNWLTGDGVHMKPLGDAIMAIGALRAMGVSDEKLAATETAAPKPKAPAKPKQDAPKQP